MDNQNSPLNKTGNILFRKTANQRGRNWIITPENSDLDSLGYARIILDGEANRIDYENENYESALICLGGEGVVKVGGENFQMGKYDTLFLPPGNSGEVQTTSSMDLVECTAPSDDHGPPVFISFDELKNDKELTQDLGSDGCERRIHRLIDANVPAKRLLCGLIFSKDGNWTSWAPHEHAATKEEIYLYFDMPAPAFGIQLVYENLDTPEYLGPVYENDAVVIKRGYHPNVAIPGYPINFVWIMATLDSSMERSWSDVNTQPEFIK